MQSSRICQKGMVKSLFAETTFTDVDSLIELFQNSDDAGSKNITIKVINHKKSKWLLFNDDGTGMDSELMSNSLHLLHRKDDKKKHGKFNFGGKAGSIYLTDYELINNNSIDHNGSVIVISKHNDHKPICYNNM